MSTNAEMLKEIQDDFDNYRRLNTDDRFQIVKDRLCIAMEEKHSVNHPFVWYYFAQDLWGARKIYENAPEVHYDVASSFFEFIPNLLAFRKNIVSIDIRPMESTVDGITYICADATNMNGFEDASIESLSALCSIEHFGLGRYGDTIEPDAWEKALRSILPVIIVTVLNFLSVCKSEAKAAWFLRCLTATQQMAKQAVLLL